MKSKKQVAPAAAPEIVVSKTTEDEKESEIVKVEDKNFLSPQYKIESDKIDPFSHQLNASFFDWLRIIFMSLTLAPLRLFIIFLLLLFNWFS